MGTTSRAVFTLLFAAGCGSKTVSSVDTNGATGVAGNARAAGGDPTNAAATDAATTTVGVGGAGGAGGGACDDVRRNLAPGPVVVAPEAPGSGPCTGKTLADVIAAVHAGHPELADISKVFDPAPTDTRVGGGDGSYIYAFSENGGGFALAFKRGGGDCPSGCTENEYWYFETDAGCAVSQVGHLKLPPDAGCVPADQQALWGEPPPIAPEQYCGGDASTIDMSGSYSLPACGHRTPCSVTGGDDLLPVTAQVTMVIAQLPGDPRQGTVTVTAENAPELDPTPMVATFSRRSFKGQLSASNLPATCISQRDQSLEYDFDRIGESVVRVHLLETPDCAGAPMDNCKGFLELLLGPPVAP